MYKKSIIFVFVLNLLFNTNSVLACACCGTDNTWFEFDESLSGYNAGILDSIRFYAASFDDAPAYEANIEIKSISKNKNNIIFDTGSEKLKLVLDSTFRHRMADITFITQKDYRMTDMADIYHEWVLGGKLWLPVSIRKQFKENKLPKQLDVKLVLQGVATACVENNTFSKWLVKPVNRDIVFSGSGKIKSK